MDNSKKAEFVRKMRFKRLSLAKGGMVKRKKLDLGGLLGLSGGSGGSGFSADRGVNSDQITANYNRGQTSLNNLSSIQGTLAPQVQTGVNAQNVLAEQYDNQATGAGPNVAQNVLNQATRANVENQASLMAGQRGAGSNPALIAREAAIQGSKIEQEAAGQAATTQAQQQIAAEQAAAQLAANQIGQGQNATIAENQGTQNEQGLLLGANTAYNNIQGQLANTTMQGEQATVGGLLNGGGAASMMGGGGGGGGGGMGAMAAMLSEGGEVHSKKLDFVHKMTKLGLEHHGKDIKMSDGGAVPQPTPSIPVPNPGTVSAQDSMRKAFHYADGGLAVPNVTINENTPPGGFIQPNLQGGFNPGENKGAQALEKGSSASAKTYKKQPSKTGISSDSTDANITGQNNPLVQTNESTLEPSGVADFDASVAQMEAAHGGQVHSVFRGPHKSEIANYLFNKGGKVPALVSPGEIYLSPEKVHAVVHGGANPLKIGEKFQGKAKVKGDSKKNDFIPKDLDEGGVVIDRENVMNPEKAALFVHRAIAKRKAGKN